MEIYLPMRQEEKKQKGKSKYVSRSKQFLAIQNKDKNGKILKYGEK